MLFKQEDSLQMFELALKNTSCLDARLECAVHADAWVVNWFGWNSFLGLESNIKIQRRVGRMAGNAAERLSAADLEHWAAEVATLQRSSHSIQIFSSSSSCSTPPLLLWCMFLRQQ
jgi:hypothetical protein